MQREQYKSQSIREEEVIESILCFKDLYGYSPSYSQISKITNLSKSRVAQIIADLTLKNLISKDGNKARTLQVLCR